MKFDDFPAQALMEITARPPLVFVRGEGSWLWDHEGKRYLDFVQGWAVNCLGHSPEVIANALAEQSRKLITPSPGVLQRAVHAARPAHRRAQLFSAGVLHQQRRGSQRRRDQARAQVGRAEQGRRLRDHHLRGFLPRPHAGHHVRVRQAAVPRPVRAEGAGLSEGEAQRSRVGRAADHRQDRRRHAGADPGRGRRHHRDGRIHARPARADAQARPAAHRRRDPDRRGPHRQAVGL